MSLRNKNVYFTEALLGGIAEVARIEKRSFSAMSCLLIEKGLEAYYDGKLAVPKPVETAAEYAKAQLDKVEGGQAQ